MEAWALAYDAAREVSVLVGSYSGQIAEPIAAKVWEYGAQQPGSFSVRGPGCPGSVPALGAPVLRPATSLQPWIGSAYSLRLENTLPGAATAAFLGSGSHSPPRPHGNRYDRVPALLQCPGRGGAERGDADVAHSRLAGARRRSFCVQGVAVDLPANELGVVLSNAGLVAVGAR